MPDLPRGLQVMPLSVQQGHHSPECCMQAGEGVPKRDVGPDRWPVQVAVEVADASIGFTHAGVSGQVCLGPGLPIAADASVDEGVLQILREVKRYGMQSEFSCHCSPRHELLSILFCAKAGQLHSATSTGSLLGELSSALISVASCRLLF